MRPVLHAVGEESLIRNQVLFAAARLQRKVVRADRGDAAKGFRAGHVLHGDDITGPDRAAAQEQNATHHIGHYALKPQARSHRKRASKHCQSSEIDAEHRERDENGDGRQRQPQCLHKENAKRRRQVLGEQDSTFEKTTQPRRNPQQHDEHNHRTHDIQRRDLHVAIGESDALKRRFDAVEQAHDFESGQRPRRDEDDVRPERIAHDIGEQANGDPGDQQRRRACRYTHVESGSASGLDRQTEKQEPEDRDGD